MKQLWGGQLISHEGIRQLTIGAGNKAMAAAHEVETEPKRVPVVFLEVDGVNTGRQRRNKPRGKRRKKESKVAVIHEGWRKRYGNSKEYELVNKVRIVEHGSSDRLWKRVRARMEELYADLDSTMVVINGDGAAWIRQGLNWFGLAIYQCDRFHVQRDLKLALSSDPQLQHSAKSAVQDNDVDRLRDVLNQASKRRLTKSQRQLLTRYLEIAKTEPDSFIDYRIRLSGFGYKVTGYRGLGACESNISAIKSRLRARSWTETGITGITGAILALANGTLGRFTHHVSTTVQVVVNEVVSAAVSDSARRNLGDHPPVRHGHFPSLDRGTQGYAPLFRSLIHDTI